MDAHPEQVEEALRRGRDALLSASEAGKDAEHAPEVTSELQGQRGEEWVRALLARCFPETPATVVRKRRGQGDLQLQIAPGCCVMLEVKQWRRTVAGAQVAKFEDELDAADECCAGVLVSLSSALPGAVEPRYDFSPRGKLRFCRLMAAGAPCALPAPTPTPHTSAQPETEPNAALLECLGRQFAVVQRAAARVGEMRQQCLRLRTPLEALERVAANLQRDLDAHVPRLEERFALFARKRAQGAQESRMQASDAGPSRRYGT